MTTPKRFALVASGIALLITSLIPSMAHADFFGGDIPLLTEIVANTLREISELESIIGAGRNQLQFFQDINSGLGDALKVAQTMNTTLNPGVLGEMTTPEQVLGVVRTLYGAIPNTPRSSEEALHDQSVAEAITLHNQAFTYADQVDPTAEAIKSYSHQASPGGAAKLTAESVGVLITVSDQILRTNAALLKINSENLALQNEREKAESAQFVEQYGELGSALDGLEPLRASADLSAEMTW